jgi:hypothetical protein
MIGMLRRMEGPQKCKSLRNITAIPDYTVSLILLDINIRTETLYEHVHTVISGANTWSLQLDVAGHKALFLFLGERSPAVAFRAIRRAENALKRLLLLRML